MMGLIVAQLAASVGAVIGGGRPAALGATFVVPAG
jgi:hypothetical protein